MKYRYIGPPTAGRVIDNSVVREVMLFHGMIVELVDSDDHTLSLLEEGLLQQVPADTLLTPLIPSSSDTVVIPPPQGEGQPVPGAPDKKPDPQSPVANTEPEWYYVIPVSGQSNAMAYGEGLPLPDTLDKPHPRIKQLARRATVTPGGEACAFNDLIPLDHCPHDVQDMSGETHPKADLTKGQYGTVSQALHIAKKLLPLIPQEAGILIVPCARGGSAFTTGALGAYTDAAGATAVSARWGVGKPLYQDLIARTKAALDKNPKNQLL
ncbi:TPA: hypothetical protein ACS55J_000661, partial [Salmonella enterica]